jgi:hypothetical protein
MEEIKLIVFGMGFDKAPGPDGFSMIFLSNLLGCGERRYV